MPDAEDFDEDVVIEGSELHSVLMNVGCTGFESTSIERIQFNEIDNDDSSICKVEKCSNWLINCKNIRDSFWPSNKKHFNKMNQLKIILQLDSLLDDHSTMINNKLNEIEQCQKSPIIYSYILIGSSILFKPLRILGIISISSITSYLAYQNITEIISCYQLRNLVNLQNKVHHLVKKALSILKCKFRMKLSAKKYQQRFSDLEAVKLCYLQPMCEIITQTLEKLSYNYHKLALILLNSYVKENYNLITNFSHDSFKINGEITYENLNQLYYVYVLTQSEMMHLLAILYNKSVNHPAKLIDILIKTLTEKESMLNSVVEKYTNRKTEYTRREFRKNLKTNWQDLPLHIDLLSRKIQSVYNNLNSVSDDLENDKTIELIIGKIDEIYKEIDTSRNFAEFNTLLIRKFKTSQVPKNENSKIESLELLKQEKDLKVIFDEDPEIMDEVYEEYIREEYLKPLYEDNDFDSQERIKLDKLLAKNFMSELKEVLIDKCKTMTEREAKALMRYKRVHDNIQERDEKITEDSSEPPQPPPLPSFSVIFNQDGPKSKLRIPVPLPRSKHSINEKVSCNPVEDNCQLFSKKFLESEVEDESHRFSIKLGISKTPVFLAEETFIGSGENSEEENIDDDDDDDDAVFT